MKRTPQVPRRQMHHERDKREGKEGGGEKKKRKKKKRERDKERDSKSLKVITRFNLHQHCPDSPFLAKATGRAVFEVSSPPPALETLLIWGALGALGWGDWVQTVWICRLCHRYVTIVSASVSPRSLRMIRTSSYLHLFLLHHGDLLFLPTSCSHQAILTPGERPLTKPSYSPFIY